LVDTLLDWVIVLSEEKKKCEWEDVAGIAGGEESKKGVGATKRAN
jgi:hypothetical protein